MPLQIREMDLSELDDVLKLHVEGLKREINLLNKLVSGKSVDERGTNQLKKILYEMKQLGECNIFVAKDDSEYIGYCLCTKKIYPIEKPNVCGCINGIFIKKGIRRQGTGTKLFDIAVNWLKKEGVTYLELYHMVNDDRATSFWKKMGFVTVQLNCAKTI